MYEELVSTAKMIVIEMYGSSVVFSQRHGRKVSLGALVFR